jgi:virginiamycin A acetyltransferase
MEKVRFVNKIKFKLGEKIYKWLKIYNPKFDTKQELPLFEVISNSVISPLVKIYPNCKIYNSTIDSYTYISENCIIKETKIGKFCSIGPNLVCGWGIHPTDKLTTSPMFYSTMKQNGFSFVQEDRVVEQKAIEIGNDVFIGMNVTILDGIKIGDGAIIGAGAVVSKDVPPYSVAVGCPIKIVKKRFDDKTIEDLLQISWWDWDYTKLSEVSEYFEDVASFVQKNKVTL